MDPRPSPTASTGFGPAYHPQQARPAPPLEHRSVQEESSSLLGGGILNGHQLHPSLPSISSLGKVGYDPNGPHHLQRTHGPHPQATYPAQPNAFDRPPPPVSQIPASLSFGSPASYPLERRPIQQHPVLLPPPPPVQDPPQPPAPPSSAFAGGFGGGFTLDDLASAAASLESRPQPSARPPPPSLPVSSLSQSRPSTPSISSQLFDSPSSSTSQIPFTTTSSTVPSPRSRIASLESTLRAQLFASVAPKPAPSPRAISNPNPSSSFSPSFASPSQQPPYFFPDSAVISQPSPVAPSAFENAPVPQSGSASPNLEGLTPAQIRGIKSGASRRGLPRGPYKPRGGGGDSSLTSRSKRSSSRFRTELDGADDSPAPASPASSAAGTAFPSPTMAPPPLPPAPSVHRAPSLPPPSAAPIASALASASTVKPGMKIRLRVSSATGRPPATPPSHFANRRMTSPPSSPEAIAPAGTSTRRARPVQTLSQTSPPPPPAPAKPLPPPPPPVTTPFSIALPHTFPHSFRPTTLAPSVYPPIPRLQSTIQTPLLQYMSDADCQLAWKVGLLPLAFLKSKETLEKMDKAIVVQLLDERRGELETIRMLHLERMNEAESNVERQMEGPVPLGAVDELQELDAKRSTQPMSGIVGSQERELTESDLATSLTMETSISVGELDGPMEGNDVGTAKKDGLSSTHEVDSPPADSSTKINTTTPLPTVVDSRRNTPNELDTSTSILPAGAGIPSSPKPSSSHVPSVDYRGVHPAFFDILLLSLDQAKAEASLVKGKAREGSEEDKSGAGAILQLQQERGEKYEVGRVGYEQYVFLRGYTEAKKDERKALKNGLTPLSSSTRDKLLSLLRRIPDPERDARRAAKKAAKYETAGPASSSTASRQLRNGSAGSAPGPWSSNGGPQMVMGPDGVMRQKRKRRTKEQMRIDAENAERLKAEGLVEPSSKRQKRNTAPKGKKEIVTLPHLPAPTLASLAAQTPHAVSFEQHEGIGETIVIDGERMNMSVVLTMHVPKMRSLAKIIRDTEVLHAIRTNTTLEPIFRSADLEIYPSLAKVFVLEPIIPKPDFDGLRPSMSYTLDDIQAVHPTVLWQVEKMFKKEGRVRDLILLSQLFFLIGQRKMELRGGRAPKGTASESHKKKEATGAEGVGASSSAVALESGSGSGKTKVDELLQRLRQAQSQSPYREEGGSGHTEEAVMDV